MDVLVGVVNGSTHRIEGLGTASHAQGAQQGNLGLGTGLGQGGDEFCNAGFGVGGGRANRCEGFFDRSDLCGIGIGHQAVQQGGNLRLTGKFGETSDGCRTQRLIFVVPDFQKQGQRCANPPLAHQFDHLQLHRLIARTQQAQNTRIDFGSRQASDARRRRLRNLPLGILEQLSQRHRCRRIANLHRSTNRRNPRRLVARLGQT